MILGNKIREYTLRDFPVLDHVGNSGGCTEIIFEHIEGTIIIADEVNAGYVHINVIGNIYTLHLTEVVRAGVDQVNGDYIVFENELLVINILEEEIQSP